MFKTMRRKRQELSRAESIELLMQGSHGTLALMGEDGYPYAVPLSYAYGDGAIYFHCAKTGHKLDAVKNCGKASFCVVTQDEVIPERFTTHYKSVIAFGNIKIVEDKAEILAAAELIGRRYNPSGTEESLQGEIKDYEKTLCILKLEIEHMTGKQSKELAEMQKNTGV